MEQRKTLSRPHEAGPGEGAMDCQEESQGNSQQRDYGLDAGLGKEGPGTLFRLSEDSQKYSNWRAEAVGGRAIEVIEELRPFLTEAKTKQAEKAIQDARATGFKTKSEMKESRKNDILDELESKSGSSTRDIGRDLGIGYSYALKYLNELQDEGRVYSEKGGTPNRPRLHWFRKSRGG